MKQTLEPIIREQPFFEGLEDRHIKLITGCAKNVKFNEGKVVCREGDPANQFFLIREGQVAIEVMTPEKGFMRIQTLQAGEVLGWSWLIKPYRWHFSVRAQRATRALAFDGKCLRGKCEKDHDLGFEFYKRFAQLMIDRLEATRLQLLDFYGSKA